MRTEPIVDSLKRLLDRSSLAALGLDAAWVQPSYLQTARMCRFDYQGRQVMARIHYVGRIEDSSEIEVRGTINGRRNSVSWLLSRIERLRPAAAPVESDGAA